MSRVFSISYAFNLKKEFTPFPFAVLFIQSYIYNICSSYGLGVRIGGVGKALFGGLEPT